MELFMRNIPLTADEASITLQLERILHSRLFESNTTSPGPHMKFKVYLFKDKRNRRQSHSGSGVLTLPNERIGSIFLQNVRNGVLVGDGTIFFQKSKNQPRQDVLGEILTPLYRPPDIQGMNAHSEDPNAFVGLKDVQFGWFCRDKSFSIEWQWSRSNLSDRISHHLRFRDDLHELIVERRSARESYMISMRYSHIRSIETDSAGEPSIFLTLELPPSFERGVFEIVARGSNGTPDTKRQIITHLNEEHEPVAPFTWKAVRMVCSSRDHLEKFKRMADVTHVARLGVRENQYPVVRRGLFSPSILQRKYEWLSAQSTPWIVAFQCEALHRHLLLDTVELLGLRAGIDDLVGTHSPEYVVQVLRRSALHFRELLSSENGETVLTSFERARTEVQRDGIPPTTGAIHCLHVSFTPTRMVLRGPYPDRSNRILRRYPNHQDYFLRVSFTGEDNQKLRFDHEVDGPDFIRKRVGGILHNGFNLLGRQYEFLAYSQSALKQYTVWAVAPFKDRRGRVNAEQIRVSISSEWPTKVRQCPALFAARLSQAFTATESTVFVEPDQIEHINDIERNGYCFSDGDGPMTQEMADAIQDALQRGYRRTSRMKRAPSVFQVRIQGAKGVLIVDSTLSGLKIGLRPSMVKFQSRDSHDIEIVCSFNKPRKVFLNRPLVMIMAGLGVDSSIFLKLQRDAVREIRNSSKTIDGAARLLEKHGLGTAFALSATFTDLHKLGLDWRQAKGFNGIQDTFTERSIQYAVNHMLRDVKYRARIPVPNSWKLVGVVDVHNILEPDEIYACVVRGEGAAPEYLHGPVVISKSPTIHPGDIQMTYAIGAPPTGSPLRALTNCVVFSQRGDRPLPNKLSGSDLDGDEYDLILLPSLHPPNIYKPGEYPAAPRKTLYRDSNIHDVANFVVNFIQNDMLGIISTNFLLIADRKGIFHEDCLTLAKLHSWAVDFPKSGIPVSHDKIPQPEGLLPDWHAPEWSKQPYKSQSVLGKLFRDVHLPALPAANHARRQREKGKPIPFEDNVEELSLDSGFSYDPISVALRRRLCPSVELETSNEVTSAILKLFNQFATELKHICFAYSLSREATIRLTEEEVLMSTIVAKFSSHRMRKDAIPDMREETSALVLAMHKELEGGKDAPASEWVNRAWTAWQVSLKKRGLFGAKSFGWIALRALFDGIEYIDGVS